MEHGTSSNKIRGSIPFFLPFKVKIDQLLSITNFFLFDLLRTLSRLSL